MGIVTFSPKQDGTGDPSPTNVRPIHPGLTIDGIGDIYGGYVDFENAEVVETHKAIVNLGERVYAYSESEGRFATIISGIDTTGSTRTAFCLTSCYESKTNGEAFDANWNYVAYCDANRLYVHDHRFTTVSDLTTALVDQTLVYKLTTPTTYSLTASQLTQAYNQLVPVSPIMLARRRRIMMQRNPNILYEAWNLSFNGRNEYIDTGIYLFTQGNINRDFEFIAEGIAAEYSQGNSVIICAKHNGNSYGFLVRIENNAKTEYNGTINIWPCPGSIVIRRINGVITVNGTNIRNPGMQFTNAVFDWPLLLGCAIDDNGHTFRYRKGTIDHVCVRWL